MSILNRMIAWVEKAKYWLSLNLTGKKFARLYVTGNFFLTKQGRRKWECRCDCGKTTWAVTLGETVQDPLAGNGQ